MPGKKFEAATAKWPSAQATPDGGVELCGGYRSINPNMFAGLAAVAAFAGCAWFVIQGEFVIAILVFTAGAIVSIVTDWLFPARLAIKIYHDRIELPGFFGWRCYARTVPIEFRLERHHRATEEESLERRTGRRKKATFREAVETVMQYGEKRVTLTEMRERDIEKARALILRLQHVCDSVDLAFDEVMGVPRTAGSAAGDFGPAPDIR